MRGGAFLNAKEGRVGFRTNSTEQGGYTPNSYGRDLGLAQIVTMEEMKFFTEEEILDKHIGKIGTPHRNQFEDEINTFLIGEVIKEVVFLRQF